MRKAALVLLLLALASSEASAKIPWMYRGVGLPSTSITLGPTTVSPSTFATVAGNANSIVGTLATVNSQSPVYSLVTGCGSACADSASFVIAGLNLKVGTSDLVTARSYAITVLETDGGPGPWANNPFSYALTITGSSVAITSIVMSGTSFVAGSTSAIGTATATLSNGGALTGTPWSLAYSGTDHSGTPCVNYAADFTINPTTGVVTPAATNPVQSYPGVCIQATPPGYGVPIIAVTPSAPSIPDTTVKGTQVATFTVSMASGPFTGNTQFGAPNLDDGGIFSLGTPTTSGGVLSGSILINPSGPGVGPNTGTVTDNITIQANQPLPYVQAFTFTGGSSVVTPIITVTPPNPQVPDTTALGATVATYAVTNSDSSACNTGTQTIAFGPPNQNAGGVFALSGTACTGNIIVNTSGPGVGTGPATDNITLLATHP